MQKLLYTYNPWWEDNYIFTLIERDIRQKIEVYLKSKEILLLAGLRRVGKSSIMKLCIQKLLEKNIAKERILFVSLDDFLLNPYSILDILEEFRKIHKLKTEEKLYLFLDEVTYKDKWQQQLKNIYDKENIKIIAASSSSSVFLDEQAYLTGRSKIIEVQPLNFEEWLRFKKIEIKQRDIHLKKSYFEDYLFSGGMPEYTKHHDRSYIKNLVDQLLYKDIIAKHNIKSKTLMQELFLLLMERSGKLLSINKIGKILGISASNAKRYIEYFEDSFLISLMQSYGKTNEKITSQSKIYSGDIGIRNAYTGFRDKGAVFENYVYLQIKEKRPYYFMQDGVELDFISDRFLGEQFLIECKYNAELNEKQQALFDSLDIAKKFVLNGYDDLKILDLIL